MGRPFSSEIPDSAQRRVTKTIDASRDSSSTEYNADRVMTSTTDSFGATTTSKYDSSAKQLATNYADSTIPQTDPALNNVSARLAILRRAIASAFQNHALQRAATVRMR